jgi:predicted site-specific integrase-resolvase
MKSRRTQQRSQSEMKSGNLPEKGVIYARSNKIGQKSSGHGLSAQVKLCRKAMKEAGVNEAHPPILDVASGLDYGRRGLRRLLRLAKKGGFAQKLTSFLCKNLSCTIIKIHLDSKLVHLVD